MYEGDGEEMEEVDEISFSSALGLIVNLLTLLLLDLECDLNNYNVDDDAKHPPHCLQLGRGMDRPLQASNRGGKYQRRWYQGYPCPHPIVFVSVRDEERGNKKE